MVGGVVGVGWCGWCWGVLVWFFGGWVGGAGGCSGRHRVLGGGLLDEQGEVAEVS